MNLVTAYANKNNSTWCLQKNIFTRTKKVDAKNQTTIKVSKYLFRECLGAGSFGSVFLLHPDNVLEDPRGKTCKIQKNQKNSLKSEFEIACLWPNKSEGLSIHPKAYFFLQNNGFEIMVMHKYDENLDVLLANHLPPTERMEAICQVSRGVATLHSLNIIHGDIYAANVMRDRRLGRYDLIDFGKSQVGMLQDSCRKSKRYDVQNLKDLIYGILEGTEVPEGGLWVGNWWEGSHRQPTLKAISEIDFDIVMAEKLFEACQNLPDDAGEIHTIFSTLKNAL